MVYIRNKFPSRIVIIAAFMVYFITLPANAELEISLDSMSPQPVEPGHDLVLSVNLASENSDSNSVTLEISPDSPILLKNENDRIVYAGTIIKYSTYVQTYKLHVDPRTPSGEYDIDLRALWSGNDQLRETNKTIKVLVRGNPQLAISNISISPVPISPQDIFELAFTISNEGTGVARDILVSIVTDALPFVAAGADTKVMRTIYPGETKRLNFSIMVKDKADISSYSIPVKMEYKDENGKNISSQSLVGLKILGRANLSIANIKTEPQNPMKDDLVIMTMRIENSGTGDAKSARMVVSIPHEGNKTVFLGKIKPNDDTPALFSFTAAESGNIPFSATLEFEDDLGTHSRAWELNQYVYGENETGMAAPAVILAVTAGVTAYFFVRRKKQIG